MHIASFPWVLLGLLSTGILGAAEVSSTPPQGSEPAFSESDRPPYLQLGLLSGYSVITTKTEKYSNALVSLNIDTKLFRYFDLEGDNYFGIFFGKGNEKGSGYGFMWNVKGELPLALGAHRFVPKFGIGWSITRFWEQSLVSIADATVTHGDLQDVLHVSAAYALIGFTLEIHSGLFIVSDYAHTPEIHGTVHQRFGSTEIEIDVAGISQSRFRIGSYYRVAPGMLMGAQYTRRETEYQIDDKPPGFVSNRRRNVVMNDIQLLWVFELFKKPS